MSCSHRPLVDRCIFTGVFRRDVLPEFSSGGLGTWENVPKETYRLKVSRTRRTLSSHLTTSQLLFLGTFCIIPIDTGPGVWRRYPRFYYGFLGTKRIIQEGLAGWEPVPVRGRHRHDSLSIVTRGDLREKSCLRYEFIPKKWVRMYRLWVVSVYPDTFRDLRVRSELEWHTVTRLEMGKDLK